MKKELTPAEIRAITDKAKDWCLVGIRGFDEDVQQHTCKFINGEHCQCHRQYLAALQAHQSTMEAEPTTKKPRKPGSGRKPKAERTDIRLKTLKLSANIPFPEQLRKYREFMNISLTEMSNRCGFHSGNIYHFETQNASNGTAGNPYRSTKNTLTETAMKYAKALGATKIEITL